MPTEPCGSVPFSRKPASNRVAVGVDQHFAAADMIGLTDQAVFLHSLDQARGAVVADPKLTLQVGRRGLLALRDDLDRLAIELGLGIVPARRLAVDQIAAVLRFLRDRLDVIGRALLAPMLGDRADFLVTDERSVDADDLLAAGHVEHVALPQQLLGALLAEDRAAVDLA